MVASIRPRSLPPQKGQQPQKRAVRRRSAKASNLPRLTASSVYGGNSKMPFAEDDRVDAPISLYAATEKPGELMGNVYAYLFRLPLTGPRFFTATARGAARTWRCGCSPTRSSRASRSAC